MADCSHREKFFSYVQSESPQEQLVPISGTCGIGILQQGGYRLLHLSSGLWLMHEKKCKMFRYDNVRAMYEFGTDNVLKETLTDCLSF